MTYRASNSFQALAEFRYQIRRFLNFSERAARRAGLEPQQHQALLALKGLPVGRRPTIGFLAERMQIKHHSAVELVNRLALQGLIRRSRCKTDRREVLVELTRQGERLLTRLAHAHREELRSAGAALLRAHRAVVSPAKHS
jgi:DNA-binding MarR family transcriptional regulator